LPTLRTKEVDWDQNSTLLLLVQDQSKERRRQGTVRIAAYQQQIKAAHHKKVKAREFLIGDLVLKHVIRGTEEKNMGKFRANWEGPYTMVVKGGKGSYTLSRQRWEGTRQAMELTLRPS